jgi:3-oxoacyl-[acyl-carrier protein] reductase
MDQAQSVPPTLDLRDRVALVTGGGRGIGAATSRMLARCGAMVAVNYLANRERAVQVAEEVTAGGGKAVAVAADVADPDQVAAMVEEVEAALGGLQVLVNNAGILRRGTLADHSAAERDRVLRVNLGGTFNCIQAALPTMRAQRAGAIVNISSIAGAAGDLTAAPSYGASKGGVNALTKSMARELGPDGIRVNAICPAAKTRLMQAWIDEDPDQAAAVEATIPLRRFGDPDVDIPLAAVFLASDLSRYVTGHTLMVDGGSCKF